MSFGKFSVKQILESSKTSAIEVHNNDEYEQVRQEAVICNPELVKKWDAEIKHPEYDFPHYLTTTGCSVPKLHALQHNYYIVAFDEIEFNLPVDINTYVCNALNTLRDDKKEQVLELVKKLEAEEKSDQYWYIDDGGGVSPCRVSLNITIAKDRRNIGNYFATKEEADFEYHRRLFTVKWKRIHDKIENGHGMMKPRLYFPCYDVSTGKVTVDYTNGLYYGGLTFSSVERCKEAIEQMGPTNVKTYILGITSEDYK